MIQAVKRGLRALNVIYIDKHSLVFNKPPGLVCQTTNRPLEHTEVNDLGHILQALQLQLNDSEPIFHVHRLDKPTTGALLLARGALQAKRFAGQFKQRTVEKEYLALVRTDAVNPLPAENDSLCNATANPRLQDGYLSENGKGDITADLYIQDGRVFTLASLPKGKLGSTGGIVKKEAYTEWEVLQNSDILPLALLRVKIRTGVKHQIRVHLAEELKLPILGDRNVIPRQPFKSLTGHGVDDSQLHLHAWRNSTVRYQNRRSRQPSFPKTFSLGVSAPLPIYFIQACKNAGIKLPTHTETGGIDIDGKRLESGIVDVLDGEYIGPGSVDD